MAEKRASTGVFHGIAQSGLMGNIDPLNSGSNRAHNKYVISTTISARILTEISSHELESGILALARSLFGSRKISSPSKHMLLKRSAKVLTNPLSQKADLPSLQLDLEFHLCLGSYSGSRALSTPPPLDFSSGTERLKKERDL